MALRLAKLAQGKAFKKYATGGAEIISADSRQVYRGMDIGTGKVTKEEQKIIKHHLLDVANPKKQFTASDFKKLGEKAIKEIIAKNKIPIIVGGTGFYIDILLGRMQTAGVKPDKKLRARFDKLDVEHLFRMLQKLDPMRAKIIDRHNKRRLIRALEIVVKTGRPVPKAIASNKYNALWLGIKPKDLEIRIKKRLDARLRQGMVKEVEKLHKEGVSWKRLDNFGLEYRWISRWLIQNAKIKMENDNAKFKNSDYYQTLLTEIVSYSKRQMTWFKKNKEIRWFKNSREAIKAMREISTALND